MNEKTFEHYYTKYYPNVRAFFLKRGFPYEVALDLTQEVFVRVYNHRLNFKGDSELSFGSWLKTIMESTWKNSLRSLGTLKRKAKTVTIEEAMVNITTDPDEAGPLAELMLDERVEPLRRAILKLTEPMRTCLILHTYYQVKYEEIARILKVSLPTVKNLLHRARELLKADLGDSPNPSS